MSFYGNMTSQLSQAFSRLLFRNNGKDEHNFQDGEDKILDATHSSASITFDSGNRWIQIQGNDDGCKIWHGAPATDENDLTLVSGFTQTEEPPEPSYFTQLNSGDCLQVPLLFYDNAGHVSTTGESVYYKLPVIAIESDIKEVQQQVSNMQITVNNQNSKITAVEKTASEISSETDTLKKSIGDITTVTGNTIEDLSSAIGTVSKLKTKFGGSEDKEYLTLVDAISSLLDTCNSQAAQIDVLNTAVTLLSDKIDLLHPKSES